MNPLSLKAQLVTAGVAFAILLALLAWGMYWRAEAYEARAQARACSESVDRLKQESDAAKRRSAKALADARKKTQALSARLVQLETAIKNPPPNATCDNAWDVIESQR